ncbi:MAG: long-chain-fatty-acid--CoA ligase [Rhodothalassiaceae bacterium]
MTKMRSIADLIRRHAAEAPDRPAINYDGAITDYATLDRRASQVAQALLAEGLQPGDRVAHVGFNSQRYFELLFGAAKAGMVLVSVNWRLAPPEVAHVIADSGARLVFADQALFELVDKSLPLLPEARHLIALSGARPNWPSYEAWRDAQATDDPGGDQDTDAAVVQLYTSGTTGKPKGAVLAHRSFLALLGGLADLGAWARWQPQHVQLVATPMFHVSGVAWTLLALHAGAQVLVHPAFDPGKILADIPAQGITHAFFVPAMMMALLQHPEARNTDYSSLQTIYYGASPIPLDLLKQGLAVFDTGFCQLYGLTETCGGCTYLPPDAHDVTKPEQLRSCGVPIPGIRVEVQDDQGRRLPPGQVGEICIATPSFMIGYHGLDEATEACQRDGWFLTGDAGFIDENGFLHIYDRVKDMIVSGGENVYPAEVESALFGHPKIRDVAVIGVPSARWGEEVKAVVVADGEVNPDEIIAYARERIAGYKCPKSVDFVTELPRNPSGKLLKRAIREPYWQGQERQVG